MVKFRLKKDWYIETGILDREKTLIYKAGDIISPNEKGEYVIISPSGKIVSSREKMISANDGSELLFEEFQEIDVKLTLIEDDEDVVKDYRLQLDVKTTRKRAKEIENYLRETLESMI